MAVIHNPHDKFFKTSMSNLQVARSFFEEHLPVSIKEYLDFDTLELEPGSYIDRTLQFSESDVLYKVKFRDKHEWAYLYVLAEHQSSVDKWMAFRLWQYIIGIWNECLKKNRKGKLPLVIPLVFYHGQERYDGPKDIRELIDAPQDLIERFLLKPFHLIDTHNILDENLRNQHWSGLMTFVMKHAFEKEAMRHIQYLIQLIKGIVEDDGSDDYLVSVLKYYFDQVETACPDRLKETLELGLSESKEGKVMATLANYLREQGAQKGRQEGWQKGEAHLLLNMLKIKFNNLSEAHIEKVNCADVNTLSQWGINFVNAKTLEEVFN